MSTIDRVETGLYRIPLPEPIADASVGAMSAFDMVMVTITDSDGASGCGYTVMHEGQGAPIAQIVRDGFTRLLVGEDPTRIEWLWKRLWRSHHYAGRGAPVSFALAAVDVALWDLKGRALDTPLWRLLGGFDPKVRCYAGNIDLNFPVEKLVAGAQRSLDQGHTAVKMRLGRPTVHEDISRVEAMRKHLGDDKGLMADANQAWRVDQAVGAMRSLSQFNMIWLEEPIQPDNADGYAHLRSLGLVPLASGENLHTLREFTTLISAGGVDFPEPDLTTLGGITPFMKVARLAEAHDLPVISHGAQEVHVHCLAACPNGDFLEIHAFGLGRFMEQGLTVTEGHVTAPDRPGHGISFDWDRMEQYRVG